MREPVEIALFTDDVEAAKSFYGRLVGAAPEAEWPGGAIFAVGALKLLVHERAGAMEDGPPNEDHFAVGVTGSTLPARSFESGEPGFSSSRATIPGAARHTCAIPTGDLSS